MNTRIRKGRDGWEAHTSVNLDSKGDAEGALVLVITTLKGYRGLRTSLVVNSRTGSGFLSHRLCGDYSVTTPHPERCTEKAVTQRHQETLARLDAIKADVAAFYVAKGEGAPA